MATAKLHQAQITKITKRSPRLACLLVLHKVALSLAVGKSVLTLVKHMSSEQEPMLLWVGNSRVVRRLPQVLLASQHNKMQPATLKVATSKIRLQSSRAAYLCILKILGA